MSVETSHARFYAAVDQIARQEHGRYNIGTYKEKKLHIILKTYFEPDRNRHEIPVNGFIADIMRDGEITEIETNGFSGLGPKLAAYSPDYRVNLVLPLIAEKYITWIDPETGEFSKRKKSPKKEDAFTLLFELVRILPYINNDNIYFVAPLLCIDEYRIQDGWSTDRKRGAHRYERIPFDIKDTVILHDTEDYASLLPDVCGGEFTAKEFSKAVRMTLRNTYGVLKVLEAKGVIKKEGRRGRAQLYSGTVPRSEK